MSVLPPRDAALDLLSPKFDPCLALAADHVPVPCPDVRPLNNINECRRLLPESSAATSAILLVGGTNQAVVAPNRLPASRSPQPSDTNAFGVAP